MDNKVKELLVELGAEYATKGKDYKGYEVYKPVYSIDVCIGYPLVIFKKGDEVRLSTEEESLEYLDFSAE